ncbi:SWIM zinc finger family protein [Polyangium mundeleinium]|uniref:SWIM zinc finger family protein n=1 Tax=Polyangium mundeleinium TaxID=2995306 RepID=A0ABT5EQ04_9BACT|nr:SWIM zinc finger family protein [Polyangium mundeleinium]MDC0743914.1 SWIM zinc finger family protein [Polyangium mundeleinium]
MTWFSSLTVAGIQALAPDARALADAKKLAKASAWRRLGREGDAVWGVALGSKGDAYAVFARSAEDARCSCPSRKRPCKHALGLLLLAASGHTFMEEALPAGHRYT